MISAQGAPLTQGVYRFKGGWEPIRIIDGRNRYRACQEVGIEPDYREWKGEETGLLTFVISLNLKRRHLNESQRAMIAARVANGKYGGDRKSDQVANLQLDVTQAEAASLFNVSPRLVASAKKVKEADPRRFEQVLAGNLTLKDARREIKAEQRVEEAVQYATSIKVEALRQLGNMLKETPRNKGARANGGNAGGAIVEPPDTTPTLAEMGLDKKTSKLAQEIAYCISLCRE